MNSLTSFQVQRAAVTGVHRFVRDAGLVFAASLFMALCSQITLPLFFTPVHPSLQTVGVGLIGATLGRKRGALALMLYLLEGVMGLPVFQMGGYGPAALLGPTGGYLIGFVAAAYLVGALFERMKKVTYLSALSAFLLGNLAIFALGLPWLSLWTGASSVLALGLYPFIVGDLLKAALTASYLRSR